MRLLSLLARASLFLALALTPRAVAQEAPPPPTAPSTVRVAWLTPVTNGAIVPRDVSRGLIGSSAFRTCAETHAAHTQVTSRIEVRFTILPDGSVTQLDLTNGPTALAECVRGALAQVHYEPSATATLVVTAFVVRPLVNASQRSTQ